MNKNNTVNQNNPDSTTKKRPHQLSPSESTNSNKEDKKLKCEKMSPTITLEMIWTSIQSMKESIDNNNNTINELKSSVNKMDQNLTAIRNDLEATKQEVLEIKSKLEVVENLQTNQAATNQKYSSSINKLMQLSKASEISIHNLPSELDKHDIISGFALWSGLNLNDNSFKHSSLVNSKKNSTSTLYLDFANESLKMQFMRMIKSCQRDINKKYIPITCDNIFELATNSKSRGVEIQFRSAMTDVNRDIFNEARKLKSLFCAVWLNQGNILVKEKEGSKPIRLHSMEDLEATIESIRSK